VPDSDERDLPDHCWIVDSTDVRAVDDIDRLIVWRDAMATVAATL
jgi:hypothetical protein